MSSSPIPPVNRRPNRRKAKPKRVASLGEKRPRHILRWVLGITGGLLAVAVAATAVVVIDLNNKLQAAGIQIYSPDGAPFEPVDIDGPINVLLIGSDDREDQGSSYGEVGNALADVIILMHISEDRKNAVALSFPRDLMIPVPACPNPAGGEPYPAADLMQINATMNNGGPACTLIAIQALTGITIPHLAMIDFKGVIYMSRAVGGVEVCVAEAISDDYTKTYLEPGLHTLEGKEALQFLRTRHGVGDGSDLSRISNQQVFLTALVRKMKDSGTLANPFAMIGLANSALDNMTLSEGLTDVATIITMAREFNRIDLDKVTFLKLPVGGMSGEYEGRVQLKTDLAQVLFDKISADEPLILAEANPGSGASVVDGTEGESESGSAGEGTGAEPGTEPEALPDWVQGTNAASTTCSS